jgi:hypothetical protein
MARWFTMQTDEGYGERGNLRFFLYPRSVMSLSISSRRKGPKTAPLSVLTAVDRVDSRVYR